jgi:ribonucleotide reductase alpha subunit
MAQMPTASTSQIMGNSESIDPIESNVYNRRTMAGEFTCVNRHLIHDLHTLGLWNMDTMNEIIKNDGSIQGMEKIPEETRALYKTVWEISQKHVIDMAADRGAYICQSQSMNLSLRNPNYKNLSSMYMYGHKKKLKTGVYYLRSKPSSSAVKVALPVTGTMTKVTKEQGGDEGCLMCSS